MKSCPIICSFLLTVALHAQTVPDTSPGIGVEAADPGWAFSASVYSYLLPDADDYVQPTVTADYRWLHLEARYNYEDLETGSVWLGYNFSFGGVLEMDFTPMIGGVFGNTMGVAPGCHLTLGWRRLELYSEAEHVFEINDSDESFFYSWSELTFSPVGWLGMGLVAQRTRTYESELEIQRGLLVRLKFKHLGIAGYVFNPDESRPTYVFSIGAEL